MRRLRQIGASLRPQRYAQGGVLVLGSGMLLVLVLLGMLLWGISWRVQQRQQVQSALVSSTRVAAQRWHYAAFAAGSSALQPDAALLATAREVLAANLAQVPGLLDPPAAVAAGATWTIVRGGGTCGEAVVVTTALCGTVTARVQSLPIGLGDGLITVATVATVDMP